MYREAKSHEPSPETVPQERAADGSDQPATEDTPAINVTAEDTVTDEPLVDIRLPEPPDLHAVMPSLTSLPADTDEQLPEDSHTEIEHASVDESDSTVLLIHSFEHTYY